MDEVCPECGKKMNSISINIWNGMATVDYPYCPKCEYHPSKKKTLNLPQYSSISGKALRGIDKKTGQFRMKITYPENMSGDKIVQAFPRYVVTKPSEWRSSGRRTYKTKEKVIKVYPELKRNDIVSIIGLIVEGRPILPIMMHNSTIGMSTIFVDENIKLKKGIFSSFIIKPSCFLAK